MPGLTDGLVVLVLAQLFYLIRKVWKIEQQNAYILRHCPLFRESSKDTVDINPA
jgi:hypothetical protein